MNRFLPLVLALLGGLLLPVHAQDAPASSDVLIDLPYKTGDALTDYEKTRCKLDLYLPEKKAGFATLVWFHGGGLTGGNKGGKTLAGVFTHAGIAVAMVNYRLSPQVKFPAYVEDAAAAFAWVHEHIAEHGGDPAKVFMGGHSAGAYLTSLVGMDTRYLQKCGLDASALAGLIPVSGQMMTHFNVRKERGLEANQITADDAAPIYYSRKETPPFLILFGDHDWPARLEENQYFAAYEKTLGNNRIEFHVYPDRTHGSIVGEMTKPNDPAALAFIEFIDRISAERGAKK